jgi:phospholipase D1/2
VAALAAAWRYTPLAELLTPKNISAWSRMARQTRWAPIALVLAYTPAAFLMFPRPLLTLVSVVAFGAWLGLAYSIAGILGAAFATYFAGRFLPYERVRRILGDKLESASKALRGHAVIAVFAANMVPVPPFGVQGIIAGAIRLNVWQYALGTFLSLLPGALMITTFGHQISTALDDPSKVSYSLLAAVAVLFALFVYFGRRWAKQRS